MQNPTIALMTDFGNVDPFIACMRGVIAGICPSANVIDLCHSIEAQEVEQAAFMIKDVYRDFPSDTLFVCVVDPGVGTDRNIIYIKTSKYAFLAPDNGLLTLIQKKETILEMRNVTNENLYFRQPPSKTFHGRDIFAAVAANLALGIDSSKLGPKINAIKVLNDIAPSMDAQKLIARVVAFDRFGNCSLNLDSDFLTEKNSIAAVVINEHAIPFTGSSYLDKAGEAFAYWNSFGRMEIAIGMDNAQKVLGLKKGQEALIQYEA